ncbi:MAG: PilT/PilU family type 4a pilus ATPase [Oscillospiraceae bacterium]|nr:PilT/PilU family type 4a pilus ATPase [Oscillospiraceae bacterium]MCL2278056.1 PilT/PilU family type 4a pilus ATPase [Oscillospiraceae bacterium]
MIDGKEVVLGHLKRAVEVRVSDIFIGAGRKVTFKIDGTLIAQNGEVLTPDYANVLISSLYELAKRPMEKFSESGDDDFPLTIPGVARFRVNTYRQRSTMAAIIRVVLFEIPNYSDLNIPDAVMNIAKENNGLALVTGPAGSGKSTTLACVIDAINKTRNSHIITLEDPIEFLHKDNKSLVSQREIYTDTNSYADALRAALRQSPDIILLGEMRDHETVRTAITAAETGHLVISTLHTIGAANTVDRIIDIFPPEQQQQIRVQLSMSLKMVVTQRLVKHINGKSVPAFEVMNVNSAIRNIIREGKTHQINAVIQTSSAEGMISLDAYVLGLLKKGEISPETAMTNAVNNDQMQQQIKSLGLM